MPVVEELDQDIAQIEVMPAPDDNPEPRSTARDILKAWLQAGVTTIVLFFLVVTFLIQGFSVYGSCMEPNLRTGERVLGNKLIYRFKTPARGDVIVFRYPPDPRKIYIKRVIGLPGEIVEIRAGRVFIDSQPLSEPYVLNTPHGYFGPEHVKPGNLFVMGDYRDQSNDSRSWGELPISNVQAKASLRYWPMKRVSFLK